MNREARASPQVDLEHPWLGLESFGESTRAYFFGRDAEAVELLQRLRLNPLLVLYGRSGLGKTSLLRARLVPDLKNLGFRPAFYRIRYRKGEDPPPLEQLLVVLEALGSIDVPGCKLPGDPASRLWLHFHQRKRNDRISHLILDQFEEIFTLGAQRPGAGAELRQVLAILVQGAIPAPVESLLDDSEAFLKHFQLDVPPLRVLLSLRQDYVFALNRWRSQLPALGQNSFELGELVIDAAIAAVFKPGELRCRYRGEVKEENKADTGMPPIVTKETAERIVRFVARKREDLHIEDVEAVPPILSLLCQELNLRRFPQPAGAEGQPVAQITFGEGESGIETIIANFYDRCLAGRPEAVRIFIEEKLVSGSGARLQHDEKSMLKVFAEGCEIPGAADERRAAGYGNGAKARGCLEDLVNQRLLTSVGGGGNPSYELIHDLLARVVQKSRTAREERVEKEQANQRAEAEKKAKDEAEARAQIERERVAALDVALEKETDARHEADRATRRARWLAIAAILVALVAAIASIVAFKALDETKKAKAAADSFAVQATNTRNEAEKVMVFMLFDLPKKLDPIGRLDLLDDVNRRTLDYYQSHSDDKGARRGYSAALRNKANILYGRGDLAKALNTYKKAFEIIKNVANENSANLEVKHDLWESGQKMGTVLLDQRKFPDAKKVFEDSLMISKELAEKDTANVEWQLDLCESYDSVGNALLSNAQYLLASTETRDSRGYVILSQEKLEEFQEKVKKALDLFENSSGIAQRVANSEPHDSRHYSRARYFVAQGFTRRADVLRVQGDDARALKEDEQGLSILEKVAEDEPGNADLQRNLSTLYGRLAGKLAEKDKKGNYPEAVKLYRNALKGFGKLAAQDPTNADWQYQLVFHYYNAALVMNKMGPESKAEAREFVEKGKEIKGKLEKVGMKPDQKDYLKALEEQLP